MTINSKELKEEIREAIENQFDPDFEMPITIVQDQILSLFKTHMLEVINMPLLTGDGIEGQDEEAPDTIDIGFLRQEQRARLEKMI